MLDQSATRVADAFAPGGPLAGLLPGFAPRAGQSAMAGAIADALRNRDVLVCEAGTGVGKTLAYLLPALLSGDRCVIATGTRNLQDQLFNKDLPVALDAAKIAARPALLKGRANYLCLHRLEQYWQEGQFSNPRIARDLQIIRGFSSRTRDGDIAGCTEVPEDSPAWMYATSSNDNCLGGDCPRYEDCLVMKARARALRADLVVINHHLLAADIALKGEGFGELLPDADIVVVDEAHDFAAAATQFFGESLSSYQALELARDVLVADRVEAGDVPELGVATRAFDKAIRDFRLSFGMQPRRSAYREIAGRRSVAQGLAQLREATANLDLALRGIAERGKDLSACSRRIAELNAKLARLADGENPDFISWLDFSKQGFIWRLSPLNLEKSFGSVVAEGDAAWIFTSATLAVSSNFQHFTEPLGLASFQAREYPSPFDYARQSLCYLPSGLPDPSEPGYLDRLLAAARPVLAASRGRAFLLFTSYRALNQAAEVLTAWGDHPLLVQGSMPRGQLLDRFRRTRGGVLLGTSSFWQGVDVRGDALSLVVIDKLPFAVPDEPLLKARAARIRASGGDPFNAMHLPRAVLSLKQGVGRLIRDIRDRGVLMLGDPRILTRGYGRTFLDSLPPMPRTRELDDVRTFFTSESGA